MGFQIGKINHKGCQQQEIFTIPPPNYSVDSSQIRSSAHSETFKIPESVFQLLDMSSDQQGKWPQIQIRLLSICLTELTVYLSFQNRFHLLGITAAVYQINGEHPRLLQQLLIGTSKDVIEFRTNFQLMGQVESREQWIVWGLKNVHRIANGAVNVDEIGGWLRFDLIKFI